MYSPHRYTPHYTSVFFFNDTATTEIYTLSLHDALPIYLLDRRNECRHIVAGSIPKDVVIRFVITVTDSVARAHYKVGRQSDRKSTRLNSSHGYISYAVFCLKKKKQKQQHDIFT